jgi:ribosomal protein S18 acetylase RimI-like enzyme
MRRLGPISNRDWYRKSTWSDADEQEFRERLAKARKKARPQYLKLQALYLIGAGLPEPALQLLDEFFADPDEFHAADARALRERALAELESVEAARTDPHRLNIRRGTPADAAALASFAARTFAEAFGAQNSPDDLRAHQAETYGAEIQGRELASPDFITLLAERDGELVGYTQLRRGKVPPCVTHDSPIEILRFYVDKPAQGTGAAQQLMRAAFDAARESGARHVWLGVWEKNPRAIAFYMKAGFVDVGSQVYVVGTDEQHDRVMVAGL